MSSFREIHFETIDSTSKYLKNNFNELPDFTIVSADYQTNGKGRNDRQWISDKNTNLLFSLLIKNHEMMQNYASLSLYSAYLIATYLESIGLNKVSIKWPNDVYVNGKKICGILLEGNIPSYLIIGVGLNVNQKEILDELLIHQFTSIYLETGKKVNMKELKENIFKSFIDSLYNKSINNEYIEYANEHNYLKNMEVFVEISGKIEKVKVLKINEDNSLKVVCNGLEENLISGEVSFHV